MFKSITQKIDLSEKFQALPEPRKTQLLDKLNQVVTLGMRQLILDNLDPKENKATVQKIFAGGNDDELFALGAKKIPGFIQKVDRFIVSVAKDLEQEVNHDR